MAQLLPSFKLLQEEWKAESEAKLLLVYALLLCKFSSDFSGDRALSTWMKTQDVVHAFSRQPRGFRDGNRYNVSHFLLNVFFSIF